MPLCACFGARAQQKTSPPVHEVDDALAHPPPPPRGASHGALRAAQERGKGASGSPVPAIEPGPLSSERSGTGVASAGRVGDDEAEGDFYDEILPTSPPPPIAQVGPPRRAGSLRTAATDIVEIATYSHFRRPPRTFRRRFPAPCKLLCRLREQKNNQN